MSLWLFIYLCLELVAWAFGWFCLRMLFGCFAVFACLDILVFGFGVEFGLDVLHLLLWLGVGLFVFDFVFSVVGFG